MSESNWLSAWIDADLPLWAGLPSDARAEFLSCLEPVALLGGRELFAQGEPADALYVLVAGCIGISSIGDDGRPHRLARISPPETVGEMALISDAPRSATAVALRDSVALRLSREAFDRLTERWPRSMLYLARLMADRLRARTLTGPPPRPSGTVAIIAVTAGVSVEALGQELMRAMNRRPGTRAALLASLPSGVDETWFHRLEASHDHVLYVTSSLSTEWGAVCRRRADHLLFVALPGEELLLPTASDGPVSADWRKHDLVVVQHRPSAMPAALHPTVKALPVGLRLQIRPSDAGDIRRLVRLIAGQASGIVLSGGGARGFAHIGVLQALEEQGRPIDLVGGTSIGAIIGAALAAGWPIHDIKERIREAFVRSPPLDDFTLPLVALLRGRKVDERLVRAFGDLQIEDLWLPFFCVSTNLTSGQARIHTHGPLARALRASIAIPGLLPPVLEAEGVLADGAMMNNLPTDVMADLDRGPVLAVDVARDFALYTRSNRSLVRRVLGIPAGAPSIASILLRAATVSSDAQTVLTRSRAALVLQPPLASIGLRSWHSFDQAIEIGYRYASDLLSRDPSAGLPGCSGQDL